MENKEKILNQISVCKANLIKMIEELDNVEIVLKNSNARYLSNEKERSLLNNRILIVRNDLMELKKRLYWNGFNI